MNNADKTGIVRTILFRDWDPIGFGPLLPPDEYDTYIPGIIKLLERHCTAEQMEAHLVKIEKESFGARQASVKARAAANNLVVNWHTSSNERRR